MAPGHGLPYSVYAEAMRELEAKRLHFDLSAPTENLEAVPDGLSSMGAQTIFHYFNNTLRWWQFVTATAGDVNARLREAEANMAHIEARCSRKKIDRETDEEYIEWKKKITKYKIQQDLLEPKKASLSRQMTMVSRSVEGLKAELGGTSRGENLGRGPGSTSRGQLPRL